MPVLDRISPTRRLKTGVAIPAVFISTQISFAPGPEIPVSHGDRLPTAGVLAISIVIGLLWQWYSPRAIGDRLIGPALVVAAIPILTVLMPEEMTFRPWTLLAMMGVGAGVVIADMWQRIRTSRAESSP
jgi:hypothetical protein